VAVVGHVDHGKSTLIGRLLWDGGALGREQRGYVRRLARELGDDAGLAWLTDQLAEERDERRTLDTAQAFMERGGVRYVLIDTPGHREFLANMLTGASRAEAAVLVVAAEAGVQEQTRQHAWVLHLLGLDRPLVAVNKMDLADWRQDTFRALAAQVETLLAELGMQASGVIPLSALAGPGVVRGRPAWYRGPTLLEALAGLAGARGARDGPCRFPVQDVYQEEGRPLAVGRLARGQISAGDALHVFPSGGLVKVVQVRRFGQRRRRAWEGESIGLGLEPARGVARGSLLSDPRSPCPAAERFSAVLLGLEGVRQGEPFRLEVATQEAGCRLEALARRLDTGTFQVLEAPARGLEAGEAGLATLALDRPLALETFGQCAELGRFILLREGRVAAVGVVRELL
jgi:small GTP-binding protein